MICGEMVRPIFAKIASAVFDVQNTTAKRKNTWGNHKCFRSTTITTTVAAALASATVTAAAEAFVVTTNDSAALLLLLLLLLLQLVLLLLLLQKHLWLPQGLFLSARVFSYR